MTYEIFRLDMVGDKYEACIGNVIVEIPAEIIESNKSKRIYKHLVESGFKQAKAKEATKLIKRYLYGMQEKCWRECMTSDELKGIDRFIREQRQSNDVYACSDNFRAARVWSSSQVRRYKKQREQGCCGSADYRIHIDGKPYLVGWNYGH